MQHSVIRVLLVDAHHPEREAIHLLLEQDVSSPYFYDVTAVADAATALKRYHDEEFDCIVLDYRLSDMEGLTFVHELKREQRQLPPMIVLTRHGDEKVAIQLLKAGVADCLKKDKKRQYFNVIAVLIRQLVEKHKLRNEQVRLQQKNSAILDAVADGVIGIDEKGVVCFVNRTACKLLGYSSADMLIGKEFGYIFKNEPGESLTELISYAGQVGAFEAEVTQKVGSHLPVEMHCSVISEQEEKIIIISFRDITQRKRNEAELVRLARYDDLTKLANKSLFMEMLEQAISRANRSKYYFALLFLDMDNFKAVNDNYGHAVGDKLLQEIALRLKSCTRAHDIIARIGGDEFTIILEELHDEQDVFLVCEKIKTSLAYPFIIQGMEIEVGASIGIVTFNDIHHKPEALLRYADMAMYSAKRQGSGHYEVFNQAMSDHTKELIHLRAGIAKAMENNELFVQFQPKINTKNNYCQSVEALLRWQDSLYGMVDPAKFIPLAEEIGIINELGLWVLRKACESCRKLEQVTGRVLIISVNISMYQMQGDIVDEIKNIVIESGIDPKSLELEITESHIMNNPEQAVAILLRFKELGIKVAIDDFGTGYSSLSYLTQFPIDRLKIDASFTKKIPKDQQSVKVVQSIISLAKSLDLKITAEGVENKEQFDFLKNLGCEEVQGYLLSHPLAEDELLGFLQANAHGMQIE